MQTQPHEENDGRRRRSEASRERIVKAMLELVGAGDVSPSAEDVAARARVGLRTVFRHFENMDGLYQQINAMVEAEVAPLFEQPLTGTDWKARLFELLHRRTRIFERIMPYKIAGDVHRHHSVFLATKVGHLAREQRAVLTRLVPKERLSDPVFFECVDLLLGFDTWRRLRKEQKLSIPRARQVLEHLLTVLLAEK